MAKANRSKRIHVYSFKPWRRSPRGSSSVIVPKLDEFFGIEGFDGELVAE